MREANIFCNFIPSNKTMDKHCSINKKRNGIVKNKSLLHSLIYTACSVEN